MDIIPHFLSMTSPVAKYENQVFSNVSFRIGEVKEIIYPTSPRNQSKRIIEYRVRVQNRQGKLTGNAVDYNNCVVASLFGGIADKFRYTVRASTKENPKVVDIRDGNKVLLLCINGETTNAVIVGALPDERALIEDRALGHNLEFEFNGFNTKINQNGEFLATFKGSTDINGQIVNTNTKQSGSFMQFSKDGTISLSSPPTGSNQSIVLNNSTNTIDQIANTGWNIVVNNGNSTIKSNGLLVGKATDNVILGTSYRSAQSKLHSSLASNFSQAGHLLSYAGTELAAVAATHQALGAAGVAPAAPHILVVAQQLLTLSMLILQMQASLTQFENGASSYLSTKNKSD